MKLFDYICLPLNLSVKGTTLRKLSFAKDDESPSLLNFGIYLKPSLLPGNIFPSPTSEINNDYASLNAEPHQFQDGHDILSKNNQTHEQFYQSNNQRGE